MLWLVAVAVVTERPPEALADGSVTRVSVASSGAQGDDISGLSGISGNGQFVVFGSNATNLVSGDTNTCAIWTDPGGCADIFVHNRQTGQTSRVSVASDGTQTNLPSSLPSISDDGRLVAFSSGATTLVRGDTNGEWDVFVHDRQTGETRRVNVSSLGVQANGQTQDAQISGDGRFVVYSTGAGTLVSGDTNNAYDVFVHNLQNGQTERVSVSSTGEQGNGFSWQASISGDGRYVAFYSYASNLVNGDSNTCDNNTQPGICGDVFVHDRQTGETRLVSVSITGEQGNGESWNPALSRNGRYVVFRSAASNLVSGDTNGVWDIFVHDRFTGETRRVNVSNSGAQANDVSSAAAISGDGRFIAFVSSATNLVEHDTNNLQDTFLYDQLSGQLSLVSVNDHGIQGDAGGGTASLSYDGRYLAFESESSNLVPGDTNWTYDVFVRDRGPIIPVLSGTVRLQGRTVTVPAAGYGIATVRLSDGTAATVAADGSFRHGYVADGSYTVTACAPGYLCAERTISVVGGAVSGGVPTFQLPAGGVDDDNDVDIADVAAIIGAFGTRPANRMDGMGRVVDINGDGVVNLQDLTLVLGNFGKVSPVGWP